MPELVKISKADAGYVYWPETDYRCEDCVLFLPEIERCIFHGDGDRIRARAYCIYWGFGDPALDGSVPEHHLGTLGCYTKQESGYGEDPNGTKCKRCKFFSASEGLCKRVDESSPGPTPGEIHPDACCNNQKPK